MQEGRAAHGVPGTGLVPRPVVLGALLVALLAVLALPFAPLERTTTRVDWPAAGAPVESTMLTLLPYRPLSLRVDVPCAGAAQEPVAGVLFSTFPLPDDVQPAGRGLTAELREGGVRVASGVTPVWEGALPAGCRTLRVEVDGEQTRVLVDGTVLGREPVEPPRVAALATGLPVGTPGLSAVLMTDSRWETSPTLVKGLFLAAALLAAMVCLASVAAADAPRRTAQRLRLPPVRAPDVVVALVLLGWSVLGPPMSDDGYNIAVAAGFAEKGHVGNYYHWYDAPETPFGLVQQALVPLVELTRAPVALRLPSVLAGLGTWLLVSRVLLPLVTRSSRAPWLAALVLLAWWLPFGSSLRPEPFVALATTAVLCLALRAVATGRLLPVALAGVVAALALATAPSGLMAAGPLLVLVGRLWPLLTALQLPRLLAATVVLVPGAVTFVVAVFADQGLGAVLESTRIHQVIGPAVPWWREVVRYEYLFADTVGEMPLFARRLAVLVTLGCLLLVALRRPRGAPGAPDPLRVAAACVAVAFAVLVLTPSKWSHHFGATAGISTLLVTAVVLRSRELLRAPSPAPLLLGTVGALAVVAAGFSGPNTWHAYGSLGLEPRLPEVLATPLPWAALTAVVLAVGARGRLASPQVAARAPATVLVLGLLASVLTVLGTHAYAAAVPLRDSWSSAGQNLGHLTGGSCGMGDHLRLTVPTPLAPATGRTTSTSPAFRAGGGSFLPVPGSLPAGAQTWGTYGTVPGSREAGTGSLTTAWFAVPPLSGEDELGVVLAGRVRDGAGVVAEYARRSDPSTVLYRRPVTSEHDGPYWRYETVSSLGIRGADLVRLVLRDDTTATGGWLAVSQPLRGRPTPVSEVLVGRAVSIDYVLSAVFPCLRQPVVAHGIAALPDVLLTTEPDLDPSEVKALAIDEREGGTLALSRLTAYPELLPVEVEGLPVEAERRDMDYGTLTGHTYPYPAGRYAVTLGSEVVGGADWGYRYPVPVMPDTVDRGLPPLVDKGPEGEVVDRDAFRR